jgi:excisionase family DNA binding protein
MVEEAHYVRRVTRTIESEDFSRREAALYLGVSARTIDRLREEGEIEDFLVRGSVRIPKDSLDAYKERQREAARRRRERRARPQVKDDFDIAVPFLEERRTRRAA